MSPERWRKLMSALDAPESPEVYRDLVAAYSERQRHYHNVTHIQDCLAQFDDAASLMRAPGEVELALWFHDAIYIPTSQDNELRSAQWARTFLQTIGAATDRIERVFAHVMATKHDAQPSDSDATFVVDIDLSILGRSPEEYDRFEQNIRKEYEWVPRPIYSQKRSEILESFLARPAIYGTEHFRSRYEIHARANIKSAIEKLLR